MVNSLGIDVNVVNPKELNCNAAVYAPSVKNNGAKLKRGLQ